MPRKKQNAETATTGTNVVRIRIRDLTVDQREALKARVLSNAGSAEEIANAFNLPTAAIYNFKNYLKNKGEKVIASKRGKSDAGTAVATVSDDPVRAVRMASLPPAVQVRDAISVANSIERDIMAEYTSGKVREIGPKETKMLMLRHMLKGNM